MMEFETGAFYLDYDGDLVMHTYIDSEVTVFVMLEKSKGGGIHAGYGYRLNNGDNRLELYKDMKINISTCLKEDTIKAIKEQIL